MMARRAALGLLTFYKRCVSPLLPAACRFYPTCSDYAREAIELHGLWRGCALTVSRLLRCHPFSRGGFDPVPGLGCPACPDETRREVSGTAD